MSTPPRVSEGLTLLTGASGFVGSHFQKAVKCRSLADDSGEVDLRDADRVRAAISSLQFAAVLHLAAATFVPDSLNSPRQTFEVNVVGTLNLLDALRDHEFRGRFLYVSTADAYGHVAENALPISEVVPLSPRNPYAGSKAAAEQACQTWAQLGPFDVVIARPFNHIGPGQDSRFVVSDFAKQIVEIKQGRREPVIHTGGLDSTRDFTDVRDVINAYRLLLESGVHREVYNICSGREIAIGTVLERLLQISGVKATIKRVSGRDRPTQQLRSVGSYQKLHSVTGWSPQIPLDQSLSDVLTYWTERLNG